MIRGLRLLLTALFLAYGLVAMDRAALATEKTPSSAEPLVRNAIDGVLASFERYPIVALGDRHALAQEGAFYSKLVADPRFAKQVGNVVVEFGGAAHQDVIDRYVNGEIVPYEELRRVWTDVVGWVPAVSGQMYVDFFASVRAANAGPLGSQRIRVWLGEPPVDWTRIKTRADLNPLLALRHEYPARLIEREILAKHRKALVIYGGGHFFDPSGALTLKDRVERDYPNAFFVIAAYAGYIEADCSSDFETRTSQWPSPALATPIAGTWLQTALRKPGCSHLRKTPPPPGASIPSAEQQARYDDAVSGVMSDGLLYLGPAHSLTTSPYEESLIMDEAYMREASRRQVILVGQPFRWTEALNKNTEAMIPYNP